MFRELLENINLNEMKDEPIITITKVVDDDTGIWADDEFEFSKHPLYNEYKKNKESAKRIADMVERESNEVEENKKQFRCIC